MSDDIRVETGTYQCPVCGSADPHQHPADSIRWFADHVPLFVASNRSADYLRFKSYNCDPDGNNVRFIYPEVQLCWENYCQGFVQATLESSDRAHALLAAPPAAPRPGYVKCANPECANTFGGYGYGEWPKVCPDCQDKGIEPPAAQPTGELAKRLRAMVEEFNTHVCGSTVHDEQYIDEAMGLMAEAAAALDTQTAQPESAQEARYWLVWDDEENSYHLCSWLSQAEELKKVDPAHRSIHPVYPPKRSHLPQPMDTMVLYATRYLWLKNECLNTGAKARLKILYRLEDSEWTTVSELDELDSFINQMYSAAFFPHPPQPVTPVEGKVTDEMIERARLALLSEMGTVECCRQTYMDIPDQDAMRAVLEAALGQPVDAQGKV